MAAAVASTAPPRLGRAHRAPSPGDGSAAKAHKLGHVRRGAATARLPPPRALPANADALLLDDGVSLADVDCIVMDCDGVIWQGDTLLPGARESIALLREQGKRLVFVTNNSNKSRKQYVYKFEQLGIAVEKEEIFSAAFAAAAYLKTRKFAKKAFVVGGRGIVDELNDMQIEVDPGVFNAVQCTEQDWEDMFLDDDVGAVIVGQDVAFTYAKLAYASLAIQRGAAFVATNPDAADALGPGMMPGAGAIVAAVETASGVSPEMYAGKPSAFLLELLKGNHVDMSRTLVVGDRLDTDVAFGKAGGAGVTVLTLSGVSTLDDVDEAIEAQRAGDEDAPPVPDFIVQGLPQMLGLEPEDAAAMELVEESVDEEDEDALGEYLEEEGFDDDEDQAARDAFGGRD
jgi:phosphoglycolate phosphatase